VRGIWALAFLAAGAGLAQAQQPIGWQEAVARLAGERTKAEACVRLLKQYGDKAAIGQGELTYADAKGDVDAVIVGLIVPPAKGKVPGSLPDLETDLVVDAVEPAEQQDRLAPLTAPNELEATKWLAFASVGS
jgi:hypothetical protein